MAQVSWAEHYTRLFFDEHKSPSRMQCDEIAQSISGAPTVRPVDNPGMTSYNVVCHGRPMSQPDLIVAFRHPALRFDEHMVKLAKEIHGDLVPQTTRHGIVRGDENRPYVVYSMPCLRGSCYREFLHGCRGPGGQRELNPEQEAKSGVFVKHLARYFAKCWSNPQPVDGKSQVEQQEEICKKLTQLVKESSSVPINPTLLSKLIESLPSLFSQDYPQVLTHGRLSPINILVDKSDLSITGIVGWSRAAVKPFGMDLDVLFSATGRWTNNGWHDYACKRLLQDTFWEEFWTVSGIRGEEDRGRVKDLAEAACKLGIILRLAFERKADGSILDSNMDDLKAWLGE